jgi:Tfp pilus assembly protein PilE
VFFSTINKNMRLRWKLTIPLIFVLILGILATVLVTSYTLYKVNLYQAETKTLPNYFRAVKEALVRDMQSSEYKKLRDSYLKTLGNVKILKTSDLVEISSDLRHTAASVKTEKLKESFFDLFKSDHERMILRIKAHLRGIEQLNPELLGDYRACGIGKWYYEGEGQKFTSHPAFKEFEEIHKQCHLIAKEVILAYNAGDSEKEQKLMKELEDLISRLNSALDKVKNIYLSETERN